MATPEITYKDFEGNLITLPLGRLYDVRREGACLDICLARVVALDCPLVVYILIRTNGIVDLWSTTWQVGEDNTFWHFSAGDRPDRRPTEGQLATLERMFLGLQALPGGLPGVLGQPVAIWAFEGQTPDSVAAKYGMPPLTLNG